MFTTMSGGGEWWEKIKALREAKQLEQKDIARRGGLSPSTLSKIEAGNSKRPSDETIRKLAQGMGMQEAAFRRTVFGTTNIVRESFSQLWERARLAAPIEIPIYDTFPLHAGRGVEPVDMAYRTRVKGAPENVEGFIVHGDCLRPLIEDGDIVIIDRESPGEIGDTIACILDNEIHLARLKKVNNELWLENRYGSRPFEECQESAVVIEVIKRIKKNYNWSTED